MKRFFFVMVVGALLVVSSVGVVGAQAPGTNQRGCVGTLAATFAQVGARGLSSEVHNTQLVAEELGVPFGQVVSQLRGQQGTVDQCLALLFATP